MDKLDSHLNPTPKKPYHPAIQATMKLAHKKINHYYSMMDLPSAYQIAMGMFASFPYGQSWPLSSVLHPGLKLEYFRQQDWEEEWVDRAENLVCEEYFIRYEGKSGVAIPAPDITNLVH
jgi:hypothetical protein